MLYVRLHTTASFMLCRPAKVRCSGRWAVGGGRWTVDGGAHVQAGGLFAWSVWGVGVQFVGPTASVCYDCQCGSVASLM